jgi:putative ABC transport system permease protein
MNLFRIAIRNIRGNTVKSLTILLCVLGVAGFFVSTTLIIRSAENSLNVGLERLGADILVMAQGTEVEVESALLMGKPTKVWMSDQYLERVAKVKGVEQASPQLYLQSLFGAGCCAVWEMFIVVYDPATDFTVTPWLNQHLGRSLVKGEVIGGTYIFLAEGEKYITLYGYDLDLKGNLEPTGMGLDQTLFMTIETATEMARSSLTTAVRPLEIPQGRISSIMVKTADNADAHAVAVQIEDTNPGLVAVESPNLFGAFRKQMLGLLSGLVVLSILAWVFSAVLIGLIFSMATHERRREVAILRAIGFTRFYVFRSIWLEATLLAVTGSVVGMALSALCIYLLRNYIAGTLGMPFLFPSVPSLFGVLGLALLLSLVTVSAAVFWPAYRISQQEPALAMRE